MIAYFDTSAILPLLIQESGSADAGVLWDTADRVVCVRLVYVEACAALAMAHRLGRLDESDRRRSLRDLETVYEQVDRMEIDESLVRRAGALAEQQALRGYDAVHLAAAERIASDEVVLVAGDTRLCNAAQAIGLQVARLSLG